VKGWRDAGLPVTQGLGEGGYPALREKAGL
jgi:hypothetical protein